MKITATRRLQYAIGHRVMRHESKCRHLHGHNFVFLLTAEADPKFVDMTTFLDATPQLKQLDDLGRVIDFGVLKAKFGTWIEEHWDHGFVLYEKDGPALHAMEVFGAHERMRQKLYLLPENPTAENLAAHLLTEIGPKLLVGTGVHLTKVTVYETENGIAEATW